MAKTKWTVDVTHSSIEFVVRHMMISRAKGVCNVDDAKIEADLEDLTDATIEVSVDVNSIDTRQQHRDDHLRSAEFFDVENHPHITFQATDIKKKSENSYDVTGDLTIRGTTRPATFDRTFQGQSKDPTSGNEVAGFDGSGKLNRKDCGLTWNTNIETGGVLVGDEVKINLELELHKQKVGS